MKVVEIFNSIEGEGIRAGYRCTFIRLYGCNLNCSYCDTRYGCEENNYEVMSIEEIIKKVSTYDCNMITITGGEPMIHPGIKNLVRALCRLDYKINIETNGTIERPIDFPIGITFTMDYKCPTSKMEDKMSLGNVDSLLATDVLKFVVGCKDDLNKALQITESMNSVPTIYISPVFGNIELEDIVNYMNTHYINNWRIQAQLHKIIWDPQKRGV
jgi:7-carboxy-7-deazaguanine synthase